MLSPLCCLHVVIQCDLCCDLWVAPCTDRDAQLSRNKIPEIGEAFVWTREMCISLKLLTTQGSAWLRRGRRLVAGLTFGSPFHRSPNKTRK